MAQITILMSVRDGAATLQRALQSIIEQTFVDWQLLVVDDASTDDTAEILQQWQRKLGNGHVRIITHATANGLTRSLNEAAAAAKTKYLARLDADDWWMPDKLARQIEFVKDHPEIGLIGCQYMNIRDEHQRAVRLPTDDAAIRRRIWRRNPFGHSCVVMRRDLFEQVGGYNDKLTVGQDLDLWFRLLEVTRAANVPEVLCYRQVQKNPSKRRRQMKQTVQTVSHYIRNQNKPFWYYGYLTEPLLLSWL